MREGEHRRIRTRKRARALRDRARHRRQAELYKEWNDKVYEAIQGQIDRQLAALRTEKITERRRQLMEDYIRVSNQKIFGLYRDIIIENEYDPLQAHEHARCTRHRMSVAVWFPPVQGRAYTPCSTCRFVGEGEG